MDVLAPRRPTLPAPLVLLLLAALIFSALPIPQLRPFVPPPVPALRPATPDTPQPALPDALLGKPEVIAGRTAFSAIYQVGEGQYALLQDTAPLHYRADDGSWQPINPAFAATPGGWISAANALRTGIDERSSKARLFHPAPERAAADRPDAGAVGLIWQPQALELTAAGATTEVATALPASAAAPGVRDAVGTAVRYAQGWSLASIQDQWQADRGSSAYTVRLGERLITTLADPEQLDLRAAVQLYPGTQLFAGDEPAALPLETSAPLRFVGADGAEIVLQPPYLHEQGRRAVGTPGVYRVEPTADPQTVTIRVRFPWNWLADPQRVYPVIIDPLFQIRSPLEIRQAQYSTNPSNRMQQSFERIVDVGDQTAVTLGLTKTGASRLLLGYTMPPMPYGGVPAPNGTNIVKVSSVQAAAIPVTTCQAADLIAAIETANSTFAEDTITLQAGCTYSLTAVYAVESRGPNGLPLIEHDTIIQGNGATIQRAAAAPRFRILEVDRDATLTLSNLTIAGGHGADGANAASGAGGAGQQGGAIYNAGALTLDNVTIRNNQGGAGGSGSPGGRGGDGGGIFNRETLVITRSTLRDNSAGAGGNGSGSGNAGAGGNGGALVNTGDLTLSDSTLSGNGAGAGGNAAGGGLGGGGGDGGAISGTGAYTIVRSTLSGNSAGAGGSGEQGGGGGPGGRGGDGGGLYSPTGEGTITASTLTANRSGSAQPNRIGGVGGGILPGPLTRVRASIIAGNVAGERGSSPECGAAVDSQGYNVFGVAQCVSGSAQPTDRIAADPLLGPLASNGEATLTHLPQQGSPALDLLPTAAGCGAAPFDRDQRGFARPGGAACDSGAVEFGVEAAPSASTIYLPLLRR